MATEISQQVDRAHGTSSTICAPSAKKSGPGHGKGGHERAHPRRAVHHRAPVLHPAHHHPPGNWARTCRTSRGTTTGLQQVFFNLLNNARGRHPGKRWRVKPGHVGRHPGAHLRQGRPGFSRPFADNGPGIADSVRKQDLRALFHYQTDRQGHGSRTGHNIRNCFAIMAETITIDSQTGSGGQTFILSFPSAESHQALEHKRRPSGPKKRHNPNEISL